MEKEHRQKRLQQQHNISPADIHRLLVEDVGNVSECDATNPSNLRRNNEEGDQLLTTNELISSTATLPSAITAGEDQLFGVEKLVSSTAAQPDGNEPTTTATLNSEIVTTTAESLTVLSKVTAIPTLYPTYLPYQDYYRWSRVERSKRLLRQARRPRTSLRTAISRMKTTSPVYTSLRTAISRMKTTSPVYSTNAEESRSTLHKRLLGKEIASGSGIVATAAPQEVDPLAFVRIRNDLQKYLHIRPYYLTLLNQTDSLSTVSTQPSPSSLVPNLAQPALSSVIPEPIQLSPSSVQHPPQPGPQRIDPPIPDLAAQTDKSPIVSASDSQDQLSVPVGPFHNIASILEFLDKLGSYICKETCAKVIAMKSQIDKTINVLNEISIGNIAGVNANVVRYARKKRDRLVKCRRAIYDLLSYESDNDI